MRTRLYIMTASLSGFLIAAIITWWQLIPDSSNGAIGGSFELVNHHGQSVSDHDFHGQYLLLFFGYRSCPDICPVTLQVIAEAIDQLSPEDPPSQPIFVSIDPERDTYERLAQYVSLFHPTLIGLTGTAEQIANVTRRYGVYYAKVPNDGTHHAHEGHGIDDTYLMDHSTFIYLMDPEGRFVEAFSMHVSPDEIVNTIRTHHKNS